MRKPKPSDCDDGVGNIDWDCFDDAMGDYEDEQRDLEIEKRWEDDDEEHFKKIEDRERYADYSDQVEGE